MEFIADRVERLDAFLVRMIPTESRTRLAAHVNGGLVLVNGMRCKPSRKLEIGEMISVGELGVKPIHDLTPKPVEFEIIFEDDHLMVINKPAGLSVHPSSSSSDATLVHGLLYRNANLSQASGEFRPGIVHRLDKDTSGLLLIAKNDSVHRALQKQIQDKKVERCYLAFVKGIPNIKEFSINASIGRHPKYRTKMAVVSMDASDAKSAITHCKWVESFDSGNSVLFCKLETGRTHQIRVHLAAAGLPVLGDPVYGVSYADLKRQALHAFRLGFEHPVTEKLYVFLAGLPEDLSRIFGWEPGGEFLSSL